MKIILFFLIAIVWIPLNADAPLVTVTKKELSASKKFVKLERIQQTNLYAYVKLVKARYILTRQTVWLTGKMNDAIDIQAKMIMLDKMYDN